MRHLDDKIPSETTFRHFVDSIREDKDDIWVDYVVIRRCRYTVR